MSVLPTVFVIDDEEVVRHAFQVFLGVLNVPVRVFSSAHAFLEAFSEDWTGCVFIDLKMPGMDGLGLFENLRRRKTSLSTILMTGNGDEMSLRLALDAGVSATLEKPFSVDRLRDLLQHHLPS